ncbi:Uncharacterised protein [uncultured archaeon]|nr:Uncharacterised protein [uncultured archaeon]
MKFRKLYKNDEAVSISLGFILMFAVTVLVFSALIISFYSLSRDTEKSAMQESFKIMGSGLAIKITSVDTLINITNSYGGTINSLEYEIAIPESIAGKSYTINITGSPNRIIMESDNGAKVTVPFNMSMNFTARKIYSGAEIYMLYYNKTSNSIDIIQKS